jgi:hypothetical protein
VGTGLSAARDDHVAPQHAISTGTPGVPDTDTDTGTDDGPSTVIVQPQDFRLPDVLRQIEAGRIVFVGAVQRP